jgi:hypothetical protein
MSDHTGAFNELATAPDTRIGTPLPKTDTINSGEAMTRVNSNSEKKGSSEKHVPVVDSKEETPSQSTESTTLLTGSKLALAHIGFLL